MAIEYIKVDEVAIFQKGRAEDAGYDLVSTQDVTLIPGQNQLVPVGIKVSIPPGYVGILTHRSSTPSKGVGEVILGLVDAGYHGEVYANVKNFSNYHVLEIERGSVLFQMAIVPIYTGGVNEVTKFSRESERGEETSSAGDRI